MYDARVSAWIGAWSRIEAAQKIRENQHGTDDKALRIIDSFLSEAKILSEMANASEVVGTAAGEYLHNEHAEKIKRNERLKEAMETYRG